MFVKFYGTRGSISVASRASSRYGGNTTCVRVHSACLPPEMWLVVDAGTGIVPLSWDFEAAGARAVTILLTHYHHDHTQGLLLTPFPYAGDLDMQIFGPVDRGFGPREVYASLMRAPFFPVSFERVEARFAARGIERPEDVVIVAHPQGGVDVVDASAVDAASASGGTVSIGGLAWPIDACLVVRMFRSNHPEHTVSYRFEERPSGQVFVFVTDHENEDEVSAALRAHVSGADLLVMDCQYTREKYDAVTSGYGHATPDYVARVARETDVRTLGLTHHDPPATDAQIDAMVATVAAMLPGFEVFGCSDYSEIALKATGRS